MLRTTHTIYTVLSFFSLCLLVACQKPNPVSLAAQSPASPIIRTSKMAVVGSSGDVFQDFAKEYCACMTPVLEKTIEVNRCQKAGFTEALHKAEREQEVLFRASEPCRRYLDKRYAALKTPDNSILLRRALVQYCPKAVLAGL